MGILRNFAKEFKAFALQGNVVDMAIGVIIGAAFKDIVTSLTDNFINPLIASIGGANIAGSIKLPWVDYSGLSLEEIQSLSLNYGHSLQPSSIFHHGTRSVHNAQGSEFP